MIKSACRNTAIDKALKGFMKYHGFTGAGKPGLSFSHANPGSTLHQTIHALDVYVPVLAGWHEPAPGFLPSLPLICGEAERFR
jgi:hypothetical protein